MMTTEDKKKIPALIQKEEEREKLSLGNYSF